MDFVTKTIKRANKKQQNLLVSRLHSHVEMARGNLADPNIKEFWAKVTKELNILGCIRTVQEWQYVWNIWVAKVKTKARKVRDWIRSTGGGPGGPKFLEIETKILDIIGITSVDGVNIAKLETPTLQTLREAPRARFPETLDSDQSSPPELQPRPRLRFVARHRRPPRDSLVYALEECNSKLQDTIRESARDIADAIRENSAATIRAAEILAAAIGSVQTVQEDSRHGNE